MSRYECISRYSIGHFEYKNITHGCNRGAAYGRVNYFFGPVLT